MDMRAQRCEIISVSGLVLVLVEFIMSTYLN